MLPLDEYLNGILITEKQNVIRLMERAGSGFSFRYLLMRRLTPVTNGKIDMPSITRFVTALSELGLGVISPAESDSRTLFMKTPYKKMRRNAQLLFGELGINVEQYKKTFTFGLMLK